MLSKIEKNFLKRNNVFVLYNFYGLALAQESLPRGQEMYDFYRPFIGYHYNTLRLLNHAAELNKKMFFQKYNNFKKYINFNLLSPNYLTFGGGRVSKNLQFFISYIFHLVKIGSVVLEKMLTDDTRRTSDANLLQ